MSHFVEKMPYRPGIIDVGSERRGLKGTLKSAVRHLLQERPVKEFMKFRSRFEGKRGLEVGGPSGIFAETAILPVYRMAESIDNCNFSSRTVWQGAVVEGETYMFSPKKKPGHQYICEGSAMHPIPDGVYDFVLSSHTLEHTANPLRALDEWKRVLIDGGVILICLPDKSMTFDHDRPVTKLEHLISDHRAGVGEDDMTHLPEILALHDLSMDPEAGTPEQFAVRSSKNFENRCLHHHVFEMTLAMQMIDSAGFKILMVANRRPFHLILLCEKSSQSPDEIHHENEAIMALVSRGRHSSFVM